MNPKCKFSFFKIYVINPVVTLSFAVLCCHLVNRYQTKLVNVNKHLIIQDQTFLKIKISPIYSSLEYNRFPFVNITYNLSV